MGQSDSFMLFCRIVLWEGALMEVGVVVGGKSIKRLQPFLFSPRG